ncbi:MAG TPA: hypothetical protein VKE74_32405, partial [Gemmataceae bacterium]|nr:hypothetical protein [Gemmataceae bacterium]
MPCLAARLLTAVFTPLRALVRVFGRRRARRTPDDERLARLWLSPMELRDHTGNLVGGVVLSALGYELPDAIGGMALAV